MWLSFQELKAGTLYFNLFLFGCAMIVLSLFFIRDKDNNIKIPFNLDLYSEITFYIIGLSIPIIIYLITSFKTSQVFVPLAIGGNQGQSFAALSTAADPFWSFFITVFTAGTLEAFATGFAIITAGMLVSRLLRALMNGLDLGVSGNKVFDFSFAMLLSAVFFTVLHSFNDSYNAPIFFIVAFVFKIIENSSIYIANLLMSFAFGLHQSNNAMYLGFEAIWAGLTSFPGGIIISGLLVLVLYYWITNIYKLLGVFSKLRFGL